MKIVYCTTVAGPAGNFREGDEREVPDELGHRLVAQGVAVEVTPMQSALPRAIETADVHPPPGVEKADAPGPSRSGKNRGFSRKA